MDIYFLGGGNMAAAIAGGLVKQGGYRIHMVERNAERRGWLAEELGAVVYETLPVLGVHDVLVLAVKPQDMRAACAGLETNGALVLSVAAGLDTETLSRFLNGNGRIIRMMPNTPAQVGQGLSGMFAADSASPADKAVADQIMQTAGRTVWLDREDEMHAITGISGSGPAYVFYLMDALQKAAEQQGFSSETARGLSLATFKGAVALAEQSGTDFAVLQQNVTSKGGTTHEAIEMFRRHQVAEAIAKGVDACVARSQEIAEELKAV
ncbi:pyrroline-5-carboxylate reductase [Neisseria sp.]|uniref:pyrroline-5-carboxylate reductase n=1 Tax=Neisseria sp. TaxID=192066 RepID=UPI0035A18E66